MIEISKMIILNGVHIFIIIFIFNIIMHNNSLLRYIYKVIISTESIILLLLQIFVVYAILINISIKFEFKTCIKFTKQIKNK